MAPIKPSRPVLTTLSNRITTRSKTAFVNNQNLIRNKRKAEGSPTKEKDVKRSAFCDVTNSKVNNSVKKLGLKKTTIKNTQKEKQNENLAPPQAPIISKIQTRLSSRNNAPNQTAQKPKETQKDVAIKKKTRLSNEFERSGESLYSTALEDM